METNKRPSQGREQSQVATSPKTSGEQFKKREAYFGQQILDYITAECRKEGKEPDFSHRQIMENITKAAQWLAGTRAKKPWLILQGDTGCGKTLLAKALKEIIYRNMNKSTGGVFNSVVAADAIDLAICCRDKTEMPNGATFEEYRSCFKYLIVDDIGTEYPEVNSFGTIRHPIAEIFEKRYNTDILLTKPLIVTTNFNDEEILGTYGKRVLSRLAQRGIRLKYDQVPDFRTNKQ